MISKHVYSLQLETTKYFDKNLSILEKILKKCDSSSIILTLELYISGFAYTDMENASIFCKKALDIILPLSENKTIIIGLIEKVRDLSDNFLPLNMYENVSKVLFNRDIMHSQAKSKIFTPTNEDRYFKAGSKDGIEIFYIDGIACGILNCFEIGFIHLWQKLIGAGVIFITANWSKSRGVHFETITRSIAIINQCFVVASCEAGEKMSKSSSIMPSGDVFGNKNKKIINKCINLDLIREIRQQIKTT